MVVKKSNRKNLLSVEGMYCRQLICWFLRVTCRLSEPSGPAHTGVKDYKHTLSAVDQNLSQKTSSTSQSPRAEDNSLFFFDLNPKTTSAIKKKKKKQTPVSKKQNTGPVFKNLELIQRSSTSEHLECVFRVIWTQPVANGANASRVYTLLMS